MRTKAAVVITAVLCTLPLSAEPLRAEDVRGPQAEVVPPQIPHAAQIVPVLPAVNERTLEGGQSLPKFAISPSAKTPAKSVPAPAKANQKTISKK